MGNQTEHGALRTGGPRQEGVLGKWRELKADHANDTQGAKRNPETVQEDLSGSFPQAGMPGGGTTAPGSKPGRERLHHCPRSPHGTALRASHPPGAAEWENGNEQ